MSCWQRYQKIRWYTPMSEKMVGGIEVSETSFIVLPPFHQFHPIILQPPTRTLQMDVLPTIHSGKKFRTVCVAIPYDQETDRILMVTSRKHPTKWILPKGGWEKGESLGEAARREAREEAGVESLPFEVPPTAIHTNQDHKTIYHYFHLPVLSLSVHFLEDTQRKRQWVTYAEAEERIRAWATDDDEPDGCKRKREMGEGLSAWKAWRDRTTSPPETAKLQSS